MEIAITVFGDTYTEIATECYCCCGNAANEAINRMASLVLHHAWQEIQRGRHPYWLSTVFEEIEDLLSRLTLRLAPVILVSASGGLPRS